MLGLTTDLIKASLSYLEKISGATLNFYGLKKKDHFYRTQLHLFNPMVVDRCWSLSSIFLFVLLRYSQNRFSRKDKTYLLPAYNSYVTQALLIRDGSF